MKINHRNALSFVRHLQALNLMLKDSPGPYPFTAYEQLRRLELKMRRLTDALSGRTLTEKEEKEYTRIEAKVKGLFKDELRGQIFINNDPRGCALKIRSKEPENIDNEFEGLYFDWGKDGLLAPDF